MDSKVQFVAVIIAGLALLGGLVGFYYRLYSDNKDVPVEKRLRGFGPNSLRALGIVIFLPTLLILGISTQFNSQALAALLGTVAGYVLSRGDEARS